MNPGRGFSIPGENGFIQILATPEKPFLLQSEMPQNQAIGSENWQDLLGIYTGLLEDNAPPQKFDQNTLVALNHNIRLQQNFNPNRLNHTQTVGPVEMSNGHFRNFSPTGPIQLNTQEYSSSNHKAGMQNPPRKVDSLAELMGMKRVTSNGIAYRSTNVVDKPVIICMNSQGESNMKDYASLGVMNQKEQHVVHANHGYNLQETTNSRLSASYWPNYNLNLPQRSEAGESSSSSRSFPLGPLTPDQHKQSENHQVIQVPHLSIDEMSIPEKCTQAQPEILEKDHNELLKNNSEGGNGGIDLNKTPQQKTPKRKKHRPKVVVEGKQKRTPKPAAEKDNTPNKIPTSKRKYNSKSGVKTSKNPSTYPENAVEASEVDPPKKSCKRALNFDLDNGAETESLGREFDNNERNKRRFNLNLNLDSQNAEWSTENINTYGKEKQQTEIAYSFIHSENRSPPQESLQLEAKTPPPTYKDRALNVIARSIFMRNASVNKSGGLAHLAVQANTSKPNLDRMGSQLWSPVVSKTNHSISSSNKMWQTGFETINKTRVEDKFHGTSYRNDDFSGQTESRENKSLHAQSSMMHQNGGLTNSHNRGQSTSANSNNKLSDTCDWYMTSQDQKDKFHRQHTSSQVQFSAEQMAQKTYHDHAKEQIVNSLTTVTKSIPTNEIISPTDRVAVKKRTAGQTSSKKVSIMDRNLQHSNDNTRSYGHSTKKVTGSQDKRDLYVDYLTDRMKDLHINGKGKKIVRKEQNALVPFRGDGAVVPYEDFNPVKKRIPRPRVDLDPETNRLWNLLMGKEGCESAETMDNDKQKWWEEERKVFRGRADSFIARMHLVQGDRRFSKWKGSVVDSVIGVFLTQNVSDHLSSSAFMSLAAKFPLKSRTMSPSVEQHEVRITFPDETTSYDNNMTRESVYNHSSAISKETATQEERNYLKGLKMLLRNDRMKRAEEGVISSQSSSESPICQASEDIKSSSGSNSEIEDGWNINKHQSYQTVSKQAEKITALQQIQLQLMKNPFPNKGPMSCHQQLENPVYNQNLEPAQISNAYSHPFVTGMPIHHSSASPSTNSHPNMSTGLEEWESRILALSGKKGISSLASTVDLITSRISLGHPHNNVGHAAEISFTERPNFQPSTVNHAIPSKHVELQIDLPDGSQNRNGQHFIKQRQGRIQESSQQKSVFPADPTRPTEVFGTQPSGNVQKDTDNITLKPKNMGIEHSSVKQSSKTNTTTPNQRKRKAEKEKAEPFNWDTLRKQAQSMAGTRERSREAKDSLDYEALRNSDVREISDTIKERGMNNMLAERIKDFLNRLVRDHEKVDLEWLRDVQPDKAKDYLLSVRGLGLKSVECVRLLTLHHLAFPVDTNVGRIAVRLGWVPLQPLPESLQLHLLEMYPVLDSIQKYLWPRLCKLDQETLYELHYQMITFGKVFCTKREPNCNACPMRAECRHFASAFASARLALPGPDERRIVTSAAPTSENKSCDVIIKPIALLPGEDNLHRGMGLKGSCEPLIEEPTTPEPPVEVSERDIEDAFYEDPDEIPVIKLNVEEFTTNLQSFMQEHMEMGEGDMSRALVALSPELASLPTPKLKHVSRLRTEHQVYELPDSHPLLKGMDRREPDDPSPYLLAIWTPGETADSVQPPESTCTCASQEGGGMCNKTTCFACNSVREAQAQTVRGTILIPCRTAMGGSFPLNGTYFQVNEVFADHESSLSPIDVPRSLLWNLPRRTVFFGTSVTTIFKGLSTEDIQFCFWKGFVCVRGFDQKTRAPRPLKARLHLPANKMVKQNE